MVELNNFDVLAAPSLNASLSVFVDKKTIPAEFRGRKVEVHELHIDHSNKQFIIHVNGNNPLRIDMNDGFVPASAGSSYNVAYGLTRLGVSTGIMGAVGNDMFASQLKESFNEGGIPFMEIPRGAGTPVTIACLEHGDDAMTTLFNYKPPYSLPTELAMSLLNNKSYRFVLATGVRQSEVDLMTRLFTWSRTDNLLVPNSSLFQGVNEMGIRVLFRMTHILQVNLEEAEMLTNVANGDLEKMAEIIAGMGPKRIIITQDKNGVFIGRVSNSKVMKYYHRDAYPAEVIDTDGAGDAFSVGFVYGLLNKLPIRKCLEVGNFVAAKNIGGIGGYGGMPTLDEVRTIL